MAPVERSAVAAAKPATIWKTCFADMKWEKWDEDVQELGDISGGCEEGTTFLFVMKNKGNTKAPCKLVNTKENERLTFTGGFLAGTMGFEGTIVLTPQDDKTKVDYTFQLKGILGGLVYMLNPKPVVEGTETGLDNIVRLSEEAEKK